jgi:hypothetical protein
MNSNNKWAFVPFAISLLSLSPLFLYSFINNLIPVGGIKLLSGKIKDKQFISSIRFAAGLILLPLFHAIQVAIFAIITKSLTFTLAYTALLPITVYFFFLYKGWFEKFWEWSKEIKITLFSPKRLTRLNELNRDLVNQMWEIVEFSDEDEYMKISSKN